MTLAVGQNRAIAITAPVGFTLPSGAVTAVSNNPVVQSVTMNSDNTAVIHALAPGANTVVFSAPGFSSWSYSESVSAPPQLVGTPGAVS